MSAYSPDKLSQPPAGLINIASLRWFPSIKCLAAEDRPAGFQLQGKVAYLHASRELDFILGVQQSECCQLYCKDSSHSGPKVPDSRVLWCNFGPEDHRHLGSESSSAAANDVAVDAFPHIENSSAAANNASLDVEDGSDAEVAASREGKRARGQGCRTNCQVGFRFKRDRKLPQILQIESLGPAEHIDNTGAPCHNPRCQQAVGTRHATFTHLSSGVKEFVDERLEKGVSPCHLVSIRRSAACISLDWPTALA